MDWQSADPVFRCSRSFGKGNSANSSRHSMTISAAAIPPRGDDDSESESVSEAGDIGDRALHSNTYSASGRLCVSGDHALDTGTVVPILEDTPSPSNGLGSHNSIATNVVASVSPSKLENDNNRGIPWCLEYISCLIHLAVFGILGVLSRYGLGKLFGPGHVDATSDHSYIYLDLPSNMVGSFLMGWWGVVFKRDISKVSDQLAIGLTTGYLGSLTTFSGWNQKMLDLSVEGSWVFAVLGILLGLILAAGSISFGIETAKGFRYLCKRSTSDSSKLGIFHAKSSWKVNRQTIDMVVMAVLLVILGLLWGLSGTLVKQEFHSSNSRAQLWLACLVGPLGVWIRWLLARLNGRGIGKKGLLNWVPFGTLIANVLAACIMAALATIKKAVTTSTCTTVASGVQFGLLGCLSTVSTFMAEFHAMRHSHHPWRAYAYATITILMSFSLGMLIYSVPVWAKGWESDGEVQPATPCQSCGGRDFHVHERDGQVRRGTAISPHSF